MRVLLLAVVVLVATLASPGALRAESCASLLACVCFSTSQITGVADTTVVVHSFEDLVELEVTAVHGASVPHAVGDRITRTGQDALPLGERFLLRFTGSGEPLADIWAQPVNADGWIVCEGEATTLGVNEAITLALEPSCVEEIAAWGIERPVPNCGGGGGCSVATPRPAWFALVLVFGGLLVTRRRGRTPS